MSQASAFEAACGFFEHVAAQTESPIIVYGYSFGGAIVAYLSRMYEDKVLILHFIANVHKRLLLPSLTIHGHEQ